MQKESFYTRKYQQENNPGALGQEGFDSQLCFCL